MTKRNVIHIEIPSRDPHRSSDFYAKLFGWESQHFDDMQYTNVQTGNGTLGILHASDDRPGIVSFYVESSNVNADLRAIEAYGGQMVVPPVEIPGVGTTAWFKDPDGNIVALANFS